MSLKRILDPFYSLLGVSEESIVNKISVDAKNFLLPFGSFLSTFNFLKTSSKSFAFIFLLPFGSFVLQYRERYLY